MAWILLLIAGLFEVIWAYFMKKSAGFSVLVPSVLFGVTLLISMVLLGLAIRTIPMSIAYPVWTGIGAVGSVLVGFFLLGEKLTPLSMVFLCLVVIGIVGLKMTVPPA